MQPGGELYSEMNRYLLSRPFCDECDVPLLDFVIFNGDVETFITEKVAALRLVRDGLLTVQDHLNLSRLLRYIALPMIGLALLTSQYLQEERVQPIDDDVSDHLLRYSSRPRHTRYFRSSAANEDIFSISFRAVRFPSLHWCSSIFYKPCGETRLVVLALTCSSFDVM